MSAALAEPCAAASAPSPLVSFDLASTIERLGDAWPRSLVTPSARTAAASFARGLPPVFQWLVLESRLTSEAPERVDLLACLIDDGQTRTRLSHALDADDLHPGIAHAPLLERWCRSPRALAGAKVLWCEWDAPFARAQPLQLIGIDPRFWCPRRGARPEPGEQTGIAAAGYDATFGVAHDPPTLALIEAAIASLPPTGSALFTASLRPRGKDVDRLFVELPREAVLPWLEANRWLGDRGDARRWLYDVIAPWEPAYIQVEVAAGGLNAHLGIEPRQTSGARSERRERRAFLTRLVASGRARADRVEALLTWEGTSRVALGGVTLREVRTFHLKQVSQLGEAPEVKAYLGVHYRPAITSS